MENFIVSARKYRPATFDTVVGQQHITNTLKNSIKNNHLAQAFLFCGPRGVGKTTCARILAKTINCLSPTAAHEACGICDSCISFQKGSSFSIHELDAASNNSVDDIRSLIDQVRIPPQTGKYKIYIIDEVHMLSQSAFNAFLKTLEEPPSYAIFILATTEKHKILPTILSRCQIFDFNRIKIEDMAQHLAHIAEKENVNYDNDGLHIIAQKADGGLRDALSMFDQIVSFSGGKVYYNTVIENLNILDYDYYFNITDALLSENIADSFIILDNILSRGFDGNQFIVGLAEHFRNLLVSKDAKTIHLMDVSEGIQQKYISQALNAPLSFLLSALTIANQCDLNYKISKNQRLQVELSLIKIGHLQQVLNLSNNHVLTSSTEEKKKNDPVDQHIENTTKQNPSSVQAQTNTSISNDSTIKITSENIKNADSDNDIDKPTAFIPQNILGAQGIRIPKLDELDTLNDKNIGDKTGEDFVTGNEATNFSQEVLLQVWSEFAQESLKKDLINLSTLINSNLPTLLPNYLIEISLENGLQESLLQQSKVELVNFLRKRLNNFHIQITANKKEIKLENKLYTATEKYKYLVEKNPMLDDLRKTFNLDLSL